MAFFGGDWPRRIAGRVLGERRATMLFWIADRYGQAGGGIIATGLALRALRTLLLFVLFLVAVFSWIVTDPATQEAIYDALVAIVPPLADLIGTSLGSLETNRVAIGILGIAGLLWGISGFYEALDDALSRIIPGPRRRDLIERRGRGFLTALLALLALIAITVLAAVLGTLGAALSALGGGLIASLVAFAVSVVLVGLIVLVVYRFVPTAPPSVRQAVAPAVLAGGVIGVLTELYALIIPLMVKGFAAFGAVAAVIGALLWLEYVFQAILFGGTWAAWRRDEARGAIGPAASGSAGSPTGPVGSATEP
jgi:YihY family inner membrane protein